MQMQYRVYKNGTKITETTSKQIKIDGLKPKTTYNFGISAYNGLRESTQATMTLTTRGLVMIVDKALQVGSEVTFEYVEYPLGLVPIGTEPPGMFGGGNRQTLKGSVVSVANGQSRVELKTSFDKLPDELKLSANSQTPGLNLIVNSGNFKDTSGWTTNGKGQLLLRKHPFWKNNSENLLILSNNSTTDEATVSSTRFRVKPNTNYTLSFSGFHNYALASYDVYFLARMHTSKNDYTQIITPIASQKLSYSGVVNKTVTFNSGNNDEGYIRFDNNATIAKGVWADLYLADIKVEEGNKATPWTPARKDIYGTDQVDDGYSAFDGYKAIYLK